MSNIFFRWKVENSWNMTIQQRFEINSLEKK